MRQAQRGNGLLLVVIVFAVLFGVIGMSLEQGGEVVVTIQKHHLETAARNLAEAGIAYSLDNLSKSVDVYGEETIHLESVGTCAISVSQLTASDKIEILATGRATGKGGRVTDAVKTLRVIVQRTGGGADQPFSVLSQEDVS
jgi:hypothetical protein